MVAMERGKYYVSGKLTGLNRPERDFFCKTPAETRADLPKGVDVVAFQCRNPIHRAHYEVHTFSRAYGTQRALDALLVIVPGRVSLLSCAVKPSTLVGCDCRQLHDFVGLLLRCAVVFI